MRSHAHKVSPVIENGAEPLASGTAPGPEKMEIDAVSAERSKLISSKYHGQRLSPDEQDRLACLTARLTELLPPVSLEDLESLLEMVEEVASIRESARERRQRLALS